MATHFGFYFSVGENLLEFAIVVMILINLLGQSLFYTIYFAAGWELGMSVLNIILALISIIFPSIKSDPAAGAKKPGINPYVSCFLYGCLIHFAFFICYATEYNTCTTIGALNCQPSTFPSFTTNLTSMNLLYIRHIVLLGVNFLGSCTVMGACWLTHNSTARQDHTLIPMDACIKQLTMAGPVKPVMRSMGKKGGSNLGSFV